MGPTAGVFLPIPLTEAERNKLDQTLAAISVPIPELAHSFWVHATRPVGGTHLATLKEEWRPFSLDVCKVAGEPPEDEDAVFAVESADEAGGVHTEYYFEQKLTGFEKVFGFCPMVCLNVAANCNGREDHRILAELTAYLSETFGGPIGLGGKLYGDIPPPLPKGFIAGLDVRWREWEHRVAADIASLPGICVDIGGEHCCDAKFLRAWMEHPSFFMIK